MGTFLDPLISAFLTKLGKIVQDEVVMASNVQRDIRRLKNNLEYFVALREDVEALAMQDERTKLWWKNMTAVMLDVEDIIDHFMVHSQKRLLQPRLVRLNQSPLSYLSLFPLERSAAKRIKDVNERLEEIRKNIYMFGGERINHQQFQITVVDKSHTSPVDELEVVGRDIKQAADDMVEMIVSNFQERGPTVFGIQGMGGIGKTTLAQKIYHTPRIRETFQVHIWLCISQSYNENDMLKQVIQMAGSTSDQLEFKTQLLPHLRDTIRGKSAFIVLDDVWKSDVWTDLLRSPFERCLKACILVTSRNLDVLAEMHATYTHRVNKINDNDGLELLMKKSLRSYEPGSGFRDIGYQIVKKCDGLPLAIKVVAGVLSTKRTRREWKSILDNQWSTHGLPKELGGPLFLSYMNLPPQLKQCFRWCALIPPNFGIHRDDVAYWWVAEGFVREEPENSVHEIAEEYYHELIRRNLLQPKPEIVDKGISTMHDLLRSLGQYLTRDHSLFMNVENINALPNLRRLGISSAVEEIPDIKEQKSMRSLLVFDNKNFKSLDKDIFRKLHHIRILVLRGTGIQTVPASVGNLVMLKLLDLSFTEISELPESIGSLISLEYLSLLGCHKLKSLPASLMWLSNISFLQLEHNAIALVPEGIANFQKLYSLKGVFETGTGAGFRLDELKHLPSIQRLWLEKLEKARHGSAPVLKQSRYLRELGLCCTLGMTTHDRTHYKAKDIQRIQQVFETLVPSPSLVYIFIVGFPGFSFPEWLLKEPELKLPDLAHMHLNNCKSSSQLPPAGQMPELQVLQIRGADAVESIGAELLGKGVISAAAFFPKLELLHIIGMCNCKYWSLDTGNLFDNMVTDSKQFKLMPHLERLLLLDCPKLGALPENLHRAVNLKRIHIEGAHELQEVVNLPAVVWLKVRNNRCLTRISNLNKLQDLFAQDCPQLDQAKCLSSLKRVYMVDCPNAQQFRKCIMKEQDDLDYVETHGADGRDIFSDESLYN